MALALAHHNRVLVRGTCGRVKLNAEVSQEDHRAITSGKHVSALREPTLVSPRLRTSERRLVQRGGALEWHTSYSDSNEMSINKRTSQLRRQFEPTV